MNLSTNPTGSLHVHDTEEIFLLQFHDELLDTPDLLTARAMTQGIPRDTKAQAAQGKPNDKWIWDVETPEKPTFPYVVYNLIGDPHEEDHVVETFVLTIQIFDYNNLTTRLYRMRKAIFEKFHGATVIDDNYTMGARIFFTSRYRMKTGNRQIKHYVLTAEVRMVPNSELQALSCLRPDKPSG